MHLIMSLYVNDSQIQAQPPSWVLVLHHQLPIKHFKLDVLETSQVWHIQNRTHNLSPTALLNFSISIKGTTSHPSSHLSHSLRVILALPSSSPYCLSFSCQTLSFPSPQPLLLTHMAMTLIQAFIIFPPGFYSVLLVIVSPLSNPSLTQLPRGFS